MTRASLWRGMCIGVVAGTAALFGVRMLYWRVFVPRIIVTNVGKSRMSDVQIEYDDGRRRVVERASDIEPGSSITIAVDCSDLGLIGISYEIESAGDGTHRYEVNDLVTPLEVIRLEVNEYGPVRPMGPPWPGAPRLHRTVEQSIDQPPLRHR